MDGSYYMKLWFWHVYTGMSFSKDWISLVHRLSILIFFLYCRWDFCFSHGSVVEHLDGHTDIIHKKLTGDWLPWSDSDFQNNSCFFISLWLICSLVRHILGCFLLHKFKLQGYEKKRFAFTALLEEGRWWNIR